MIEISISSNKRTELFSGFDLYEITRKIGAYNHELHSISENRKNGKYVTFYFDDEAKANLFRLKYL